MEDNDQLNYTANTIAADDLVAQWARASAGHPSESYGASVASVHFLSSLKTKTVQVV